MQMSTKIRKLAPAHPGAILRELFIKEYALTITEVADGIGIARVNLSAIVNERAGISPELAIKLSVAFNNTPWILDKLAKQLRNVVCRKKCKQEKN